MAYETDDDVEAVVFNFETCGTNKEDFHHSHHLVVATWYLQDSTIEEATEKMRNSLFRFIDHHGVNKQKYHETLTVFWMEMVALELRKLSECARLVDKCNSIVSRLNNAKLPLKFYSEGLLWSDEARQVFMTPDLKRWN